MVTPAEVIPHPPLKVHHQLWLNNAEVEGRVCSLGDVHVHVWTVIQQAQSMTIHKVLNPLVFGVPSIPSPQWIVAVNVTHKYIRGQ